MSENTNTSQEQASNQPTEQANEAPSTAAAPAQGAKINFLKMGVSVGAGCAIALMLLFVNALADWGAMRAYWCSGFLDGLIYDIQLISAIFLFLISAIATVAGSCLSISDADSKTGGFSFAKMLPHFLGVLVVLGVGVWGLIVSWKMLTVGAYLWWNGVNATIVSIFYFPIVLISIVFFLAAMAAYGYFMVKAFTRKS